MLIDYNAIKESRFNYKHNYFPEEIQNYIYTLRLKNQSPEDMKAIGDSIIGIVKKNNLSFAEAVVLLMNCCEVMAMN